jgi:toxin YoeB
MGRAVFFDRFSWTDFYFWKDANWKTMLKVSDLIEQSRWNPRDGIGKPERLKHMEVETWSRRIDAKNRITYFFDDSRLCITRCRGHYNDR